MYQGLGLFLGKQNTRETTAQAAGHSERSRRTRPQAWARTFRVMYGEPRLTNRQQTPAPRLKLKGAGSTPDRQTEIGDKYRCRQTPASGKCSSRVRPPGLPLAHSFLLQIPRGYAPTTRAAHSHKKIHVTLSKSRP